MTLNQLVSGLEYKTKLEQELESLEGQKIIIHVQEPIELQEIIDQYDIEAQIINGPYITAITLAKANKEVQSLVFIINTEYERIVKRRIKNKLKYGASPAHKWTNNRYLRKNCKVKIINYK